MCSQKPSHAVKPVCAGVGPGDDTHHSPQQYKCDFVLLFSKVVFNFKALCRRWVLPFCWFFIFIYRTFFFFTDSNTSLGFFSFTAAHASLGKVSKETEFFCGRSFCLIGPLGTESTKSPETALMGVGGFGVGGGVDCRGGNQFSLRLTPSFTCSSQQEAEGKISVLGIVSPGGGGDGRGGGPWKTGCSVEFGQDGCAVILKLLWSVSSPRFFHVLFIMLERLSGCHRSSEHELRVSRPACCHCKWLFVTLTAEQSGCLFLFFFF